MKIKQLTLARDDLDDFCVKDKKGPLFVCGVVLRKFFPHITARRQKITLTVFSHAVKGSRLFHIRQHRYKGAWTPWTDYILVEAKEHGLYDEPEHLIEETIRKFRPDADELDDVSMPVWVVVE